MRFVFFKLHLALERAHEFDLRPRITFGGEHRAIKAHKSAGDRDLVVRGYDELFLNRASHANFLISQIIQSL
jgi:hypothetical protein